MDGRSRIIAAVDVPDLRAAVALAEKLAGRVGLLKVGLELYVAHGPLALEVLAPFGLPVFLDLKFHDIPQTVEHAARGAGALGAAMITVHASGGAAMIAAARRGLHAGAAQAGRKPPALLAVTVLTSLGDDDLSAIGLAGPAAEAVLRLGRLAIAAGADGLVCSPAEVALLRRELGAEVLLVVPGIRPLGSDKGDQRRVGTPRETVDAGATYLVIGRPLRDAADPGAAAEEITRLLDAR